VSYQPQWETVKVSASTLDRVARCEASAALPQIVDANEDNKSQDGRDKGGAAHSFLERVPEVGRDAALLEVDAKWRGFCESINLAKLSDHLKLSREVTLVYNWMVDTARIGEPDESGRVQINRDCELVARTDLLGYDADRRCVYIGDYKTGSSWLPSPDASYQLGLAAVAASRVFKARTASVEYIRIRDDGSIRRFDADLDLFGLDGAAEKIAVIMRRTRELRARIVDGFVPNVVEGQWCKYCPARQHCPAKTALIRTVLHDPQPIPYVQPLTPEIALTAYVQLKRAKDALKQIETVLYAYAKTTPIPLGEEEDGSLRFFGELTREGNDVLDGAIAHAVLAERFGGEIANGAVTMETSKKAITKVVQACKQPDETAKSVFDSIIQAIDERGGISNPTTTSTIEFTVAPDGLAKARKRKAV
jgi:hypothetical protein